ncbi:MAG: signal peptide peptidase SppA [Elusimicrobia bacterium]|nr:MAG: signal peptide peptidase SppA [Elusimicrobiota bacterium]
MNEEWTPEPQPEPSEDVPEVTPPDKPKRRRLAVRMLVGLYAVSLFASGSLLWRSRSAGVDADSATKEGKSAVQKISHSILSSTKDKQYIAVVNISGAIYAGDGRRWGRGASNWRRRIEKLAKKSEVKGIVLAINSPGGSVGSVQDIYSTIQRIRRETGKPFVAQLGDVAASGGYYLAAACDKIVAHPGTLVGSIGVIFSRTNVEGLLKKVGVTMGAIKSGKMKDIGSMSRPMTAEERRLLQGLIDNAYGQFLTAVADGRGLSKDEVRPHADGRIFTGEQALGFKLIDQVGDFHDAIALAGKLAGIDGEPELYPESESISSLMDMLEMRLSVVLEPRLSILREIGIFGYAGLEYRWSH